MELTRGHICTKCGKDFSKIEGNCEINTDKTFYGGRVNFFQTKECECGTTYKLCIGQTSSGLKVIDMIVLERKELPKEKAIENKDEKNVTSTEKEEKANTETVTDSEKEIQTEDKTETVVEKPKIVVEMASAKSKLMLLTRKELQTMLRRRRIRFDKNLATKEELVDKLLLRNPTGLGLFKE